MSPRRGHGELSLEGITDNHRTYENATKRSFYSGLKTTNYFQAHDRSVPGSGCSSRLFEMTSNLHQDHLTLGTTPASIDTAHGECYTNTRDCCQEAGNAKRKNDNNRFVEKNVNGGVALGDGQVSGSQLLELFLKLVQQETCYSSIRKDSQYFKSKTCTKEATLLQKGLENGDRLFKNYVSEEIRSEVSRELGVWRLLQQMISNTDLYTKNHDANLSQKFHIKGLNSSFLSETFWFGQDKRQGSWDPGSTQCLRSAARDEVCTVVRERISDIGTKDDRGDEEVDESTVEEDSDEKERPGNRNNVPPDSSNSASVTTAHSSNNKHSKSDTNGAGSCSGAGGGGREGGDDDGNEDGDEKRKKDNPKSRRKPRKQRKTARMTCRSTWKMKRQFRSRLRSKLRPLARRTMPSAKSRQRVARLVDIAWPLARRVQQDGDARKRPAGLQRRFHCRAHPGIPASPPSRKKVRRKGSFQDPFAGSKFPADHLSKFKNGPWAAGALHVRDHVLLAAASPRQSPRKRRCSGDCYREKRKKRLKLADLCPPQTEGQRAFHDESSARSSAIREHPREQDGETQQHVSGSDGCKTPVPCTDGEFCETPASFSLPALQDGDAFAIGTPVLPPDLSPDTTARVQGLNLRPHYVVHHQCEEDLILHGETRRRLRGNIRHPFAEGHGGGEDEGNNWRGGGGGGRPMRRPENEIERQEARGGDFVLGVLLTLIGLCAALTGWHWLTV